MKVRSIFSASIIAVVSMILLSPPLIAGEGGLTPDNIEKIRNAYEMDRYGRAMYNAVTNNSIDKIALNRDILRGHNEIFSHEIKTKGVTNQKSSGRCWLFASLNRFRPLVIEKYDLKKFEFSQNYLAFWDKMEKANTFLEFVIEMRDRDPLDRELAEFLRHPIGDGGYWLYTVDLIQKYGAVPKEIMPETNSSGSTWQMNKVLKRKLRSAAANLRAMHNDGKSVKQLRAEKETVMADIYKILVMNLGEPPTQFEWRVEIGDTTNADDDDGDGDDADKNDADDANEIDADDDDNGDKNDKTDKKDKLIMVGTYTPQSFFEEVVGVDLDQYVNIFNNPTQEYDNHFLAVNTRNMYDRDDLEYVSVEMDRLREIAMKSVLNDDPVVFSCDVGKDQYEGGGIMAMDVFDFESVFDTDLSMSKADMCTYFESSSNHMMLIIGVDVRDDKPVKWRVENSWGTKRGSDGYWTMYDDWFGMYAHSIIVKKEYVPQEILDLYDKEPIILPVWDPNTSMMRR